MPQTTAEKKFFPNKADKFFSNIVPATSKTYISASLQQYKGFLKNITGGEE